MIKRLIPLLTILLCFSAISAQISSRTAFRVRYGASLPATCNATTGMVFFLNAGAIGLYSCTATNTWAAAGAISISGTPVNNQIAIWTDASTLEGDADLTFSGTTLFLGNSEEEDIQINLVGDAATYAIGIEDATDSFQVVLGSVLGTTEVVRADANFIIFNNDQQDLDFRVHSDIGQSAIAVDANRHRIGLGSAAPLGATVSINTGAENRSLVSGVGLFNITADTIVDTSATDPIALVAGMFLVILTFTDATKIYTAGANLYIEGAAAVTGGASMTNAYAQWNDAGLSRFDDGVQTGEPDVGGLLSVLFATATVTTSSGSSQTASNLIPAGVFVIGVSTTVETLVTGPAGYDVGDGTTVDLWGNSILVADGTTSDITDFTADGFGQYTAANDVVITTDGVDFTAGVIRITVQYLGITAGVD